MTKIIKLGAITFYLILLVVLTGCPAPEQSTDTPSGDESELFTLVVLHTNDLHARISEFNRFGNTTSREESEAGEGIGGYPRIATMVNQLRGDSTNTLLLDAGDQFQGTLFYNLFKGEASKVFMNDLGYDAMTMGNHEFDDGPEILAEFISGLDFPIVSSNVKVENEPLLSGLVKPYEVLTVDGHKIGIVGFMTPDVPMISKPGPNIEFANQEESAQMAVDILKDQDVNIIIALSHSGLAKDMEIAATVDGIDIIVGGHTHSLLSNTDEDAEGPYPIMVQSPSEEPVLIVQAKSWGWYLGHLVVDFNSEGVAETWSGEPVLLDASVPKDEETLARVMEMNSGVEELQGMIVGESLVDLDGTEEGCRHNESNLGDLIADALLWEAKPSGAQIAFYNGGGIRSGIQAGTITLAQIFEVLPFTDTMATLNMLGSDLKRLLEYSVSRAEDPRNEGTGRFLQFAGLKFVWDPEAEVGNRVVEINIQNDDGTYTAMDDYQVYKIATSGFLRGGGDGFTILQEDAIDPYDFGRVISDVVTEYISLNSPVSPRVEGRITRAR